MSERSTASTISAAMSRGLRPSRLARPIAALHWKSANCEGRMIGSASANSGPKAAAKAVWKRWVSAISGAGMGPRVVAGQGRLLPARRDARQTSAAAARTARTGDRPMAPIVPAPYAGTMRSLLTLVLNIIWLLTAGWALFLGYLLAGV